MEQSRNEIGEINLNAYDVRANQELEKTSERTVYFLVDGNLKAYKKEADWWRDDLWFVAGLLHPKLWVLHRPKSGGFSLMQKSTAALSYDYTASKGPRLFVWLGLSRQ
ncbi:hypothetical protein TNCV_3178381, partial [Trichonephila clavipes]